MMLHPETVYQCSENGLTQNGLRKILALSGMD
jgi:hypothetical protein